MAMNKIERIDKEIAKTREKITEYQNKLSKSFPDRRTIENSDLCANSPKKL